MARPLRLRARKANLHIGLKGPDQEGLAEERGSVEEEEKVEQEQEDEEVEDEVEDDDEEEEDGRGDSRNRGLETEGATPGEREFSNSSGGANPNAFAAAFASIMRRKLPQKDTVPILAARKLEGGGKGAAAADGGEGAGRVREGPEGSEEGEAEDERLPAPRRDRLEERERHHMLPQTFTDSKERALRKIATKGVVRLFNAVSKAQGVQQEEQAAGSASLTSAASREASKRTKAAFLSELRGSVACGAPSSRGGGPRGHAAPGATDGSRPPAADRQKKQGDAGPSWPVLEDDFLLNPAKYRNGKDDLGSRGKKRRGEATVDIEGV